jgi:glycerol kinase
VLDPYFSASKLQWLLDNVPDARRRAERGELAFGTIDSWLLWQLSGGRRHLTDASNASRTQLFDIHLGRWDPALLALWNIPPAVLPEVVDSSGELLEVDPSLGLGRLVCGIAGDQQAALFGQQCFDAGSVKCTYGTGCFILANAGLSPPRASTGLLGTVAWRLGGQLTYALEGSVFMGGATVQWLRDGLGLIARAEDIEALAGSVHDSAGVVLVPAFTGLGAPHWDPDARGLIIGLSRGTTKGHIARAALEAIALQVADLLTMMSVDLPEPLLALRVDGGATGNNLLMQMQADLAGMSLHRAAQRETTAVGAALLAGLGAGVWSSAAALGELQLSDRSFTPAGNPLAMSRLRARWQAAVQRTRGWAALDD